MKKWISLILAMLMIGVCAAGVAEGAEETGKTAFLRIKEGVTAQVYEKPGDEKAIDSLAGGKFCGLIDTVTAESGDAWYQVFYLNSKGEGTPGYIKAEDADQLTEEELNALMEDPAVLNEILDLVDALDTMSSKLGSTDPDPSNFLQRVNRIFSDYKSESYVCYIEDYSVKAVFSSDSMDSYYIGKFPDRASEISQISLEDYGYDDLKVYSNAAWGTS